MQEREREGYTWRERGGGDTHGGIMEEDTLEGEWRRTHMRSTHLCKAHTWRTHMEEGGRGYPLCGGHIQGGVNVYIMPPFASSETKNTTHTAHLHTQIPPVTRPSLGNLVCTFEVNLKDP